MTIRSRLILITALLSAAIGAFTAFYVNYYLLPRAAITAADHRLIGTVRPNFSLYDLDENYTSISTWDGKIVLLNFWASWCPPCRREIPIFNEVRELFHANGFEVVGIAVDEKEKVLDFLESVPQVQYPQLIGYDDALTIASVLGNRSGGLPYSVLVDQQGTIRYIKAGELDRQTLIAQIEPLLALVKNN